jgi:large subunit ribosomal protein L28
MLRALRFPSTFHSSLRYRKPQKRQKTYIESRFKDLSVDDLFHISLIRKKIHQKVPGMTIRSQRGLFHGKLRRSGVQSCFSEKKSLRPFKPNVQKKKYWSNLLQREITINVTTTTMKKINYYGGFDNYVLLAKPEKMWSSMGEYLRRVMLAKLSNSNLNLENKMIFGTEPNLYLSKRRRMQFKKKMYLPGDMRHSDLTYYTMNRVEDYSRRQLKILEAYHQGEEAFEKYKEETQKIWDWENEYKKKHEKTTSKLQLKLSRWLMKKSKNSPEFFKLFEMQKKNYHEDILANESEYFKAKQNIKMME